MNVRSGSGKSSAATFRALSAAPHDATVRCMALGGMRMLRLDQTREQKSTVAANKCAANRYGDTLKKGKRLKLEIRKIKIL